MGTYDLLEPLRKMRERSQNASAVNSAFNETDSQPQLSQLHKTVETDFNTIQGNSEFINMSRTDPSSLLEFTPATPKPKDSRVHLNEEETEPITPLDDSWIDQKIPIVLDQPVDYPAHLHAMSFPPGNISVFPQAPSNNGVVSECLRERAKIL